MTPDRSLKLTAEKVAEIRRVLGEGSMSRLDLAHLYGVSPTAIRMIAVRETWKDVPGPPPRYRPRSNTGYWGVTANGANNRFQVQIREDRRQWSLGIFKDSIEAARVYDARARELGFPREKLNFPDDE